MKTGLNILGGLALPLAVAAEPLRAQTNSAIGEPSRLLSIVGLGFGEDMIALAAFLAVCSIPIIIVSIQISFRHSREKLLHETIRSMVEKGAPIPPELLTRPQSGVNLGMRFGPRHDLRNGLLLLGVGLGTVVVGYTCGWIIIFLGLAFVVASRFEKKDKSDGQPPQSS